MGAPASRVCGLGKMSRTLVETSGGSALMLRPAPGFRPELVARRRLANALDVRPSDSKVVELMACRENKNAGHRSFAALDEQLRVFREPSSRGERRVWLHAVLRKQKPTLLERHRIRAAERASHEHDRPRVLHHS